MILSVVHTFDLLIYIHIYIKDKLNKLISISMQEIYEIISICDMGHGLCNLLMQVL